MITAGIILIATAFGFAHLADQGANLFALFWALVCLGFGMDALVFGISLLRARRAAGLTVTGRERWCDWFGPHSHFGLSAWRAGERSQHLGLQLWPTLALRLNLSWYTMRPTHGPQTWPWWRLFSQTAVCTNTANTHKGTCGWNLWTYTRWGAWCNHVAIDRRTPAQRGLA